MDSREFEVEVGENSWLWLNPPLNARLDRGQTAKILLFAKRLPESISFFSNGKSIASAKLYVYNLSEGVCGEKIVERSFSPKNESLTAISSLNPELPFQLEERNATIMPFYLEFGFAAQPGAARVDMGSNDSFGHSQSLNRNFSVRAPDKFSGNDENNADEMLSIRDASDSQAPAAYPIAMNAAKSISNFAQMASLLAFPFCLLAAYYAVRAQRLI
jgi:hypothetical protein